MIDQDIHDYLDAQDRKGGGTPLTDTGTVDHAAVAMASRRRAPADDVYPHTERAAEDEELLDQWGQA